MQSKNIFKSKTFWTNFIVGTGLFFTNYTGAQLPVENSTVAVALAAANIFLRGITEQPVHVMPKEE